ncbi:pyridoxal phosphate-dependent transferase [Halenospora varia]|nr:pyridoxal phosphate-dependent transferase [Halenospora varia]
MSPSAIVDLVLPGQEPATSHVKSASHSSGHTNGCTNGYINGHANGFKRAEFHLNRNIKEAFPVVIGGKGNHLQLADGRTIFDASSKAAVSCLGHGNTRINDAISAQLSTGTPYLCSSFWSSKMVEDLCEELINGTEGKMSRAYLTGSGSEAMEALIKLARQYYYLKDPDTPRVNVIAREGSYYGNTIGALGVSGHIARRALYEPFLINVHCVSACNAYRQRLDSESDASFVARKSAELEAKFQELGPETVIGFVCEPVVRAALGCVPCVPGYLRAIRDVCYKHGALFILDEVMSGMGRCGTLHAWQDKGVAPDLQTIGKGLAGGYQPIIVVLISKRVVNALLNSSGQFVKREENLIENVRIQGVYLEKLLKARLSDHPNVSDIRGKGLFWGLEFVYNAAISAPFNMTTYPGTGTVDGTTGDHVIIAPTYIYTSEDIDHIVNVVVGVVNQVFYNL